MKQTSCLHSLAFAIAASFAQGAIALDRECLGSLCFSADRPLSRKLPREFSKRVSLAPGETDTRLCFSSPDASQSWHLQVSTAHEEKSGALLITRVTVTDSRCSSPFVRAYPWGELQTLHKIKLGSAESSVVKAYGAADRVLTDQTQIRLMSQRSADRLEAARVLVYRSAKDQLYEVWFAIDVNGKVIGISVGSNVG